MELVKKVLQFLQYNVIIMEEILKNLQEECNKIYKKEGPSDEVIDLQVAINQLRNKYNISDKTQITDSNPGFVQ